MSLKIQETPPATGPADSWQPLTFGGVARFAYSRWSRLLLVQFIISLIVAASAIYLFKIAWFATIREAVAHLPESARLENGQLSWPDSLPLDLADGSFLSIIVDPDGSLQPGQIADVQITLEKNRLRLRSILGELSLPYRAQWQINLDRNEAEPWWGAWEPVMLVGLGALIVIGLFAFWIPIALLYALPAGLIAFYADREVDPGGCWKLSFAALLPGALFLSLAILAYAAGRIHFIGFLVAIAAHLLIGLIYDAAAPFRLRPLASSRSQFSPNPFHSPNGVRG